MCRMHTTTQDHCCSKDILVKIKCINHSGNCESLDLFYSKGIINDESKNFKNLAHLLLEVISKISLRLVEGLGHMGGTKFQRNPDSGIMI